MAITQDGTTCSDPLSYTGTDLARMQQVGTLSVGSVALERLRDGPSTLDSGTAWFALYNGDQFISARGLSGSPSLGTCTVYPFVGTGFKTADPVRPVLLDAGLWIAITRADLVQRQLTLLNGVYSAQIGGASGLSPFLEPGMFTIDNTPNGPGQRTVLPFTTTMNIAAGVNWGIQLTTVSRSQDLTVSWSGLDPATRYVQMTGYSIAGGVGATFVCTASASAQSLRVPSVVLSALPIGSGELRVATSWLPVRVAIPNISLDALYLSYSDVVGRNVDYGQ
jgi:hypothetical protein